MNTRLATFRPEPAGISDADIQAAAARISEAASLLRLEAERKAWNAAIDRAQEIVAEWIANGREPQDLYDQLQDAKRWTP